MDKPWRNMYGERVEFASAKERPMAETPTPKTLRAACLQWVWEDTQEADLAFLLAVGKHIDAWKADIAENEDAAGLINWPGTLAEKVTRILRDLAAEQEAHAKTKRREAEARWLLEKMDDIFTPDSAKGWAARRRVWLAPNDTENADAHQVPGGYIDDGFGNIESRRCPECGQDTMQIVRPGKVQCSNCG